VISVITAGHYFINMDSMSLRRVLSTQSTSIPLLVEKRMGYGSWEFAEGSL
jgi:hypothetical protein